MTMRRLAWATDVHLDMAGEKARQKFFHEVRERDADGLLLTGDIAEAPLWRFRMEELLQETGTRIYFVLGNHDRYLSSFEDVDIMVRVLCTSRFGFTYLSAVGSRPFADPTTVLIGQDGWYDARLGKRTKSPVQLTDFSLISNLRAAGSSRDALETTLLALGRMEAVDLEQKLTQLPAETKRIFVATHVPPFQEACWHEGRISDPDHLPYFTWASGGEVLRSYAERHPSTTIVVLCGHTHSSGTVAILPNLTVHTGSAVYGKPALQAFELEL
jgi:Icc-related predicted phosphoesterase